MERSCMHVSLDPWGRYPWTFLNHLAGLLDIVHRTEVYRLLRFFCRRISQSLAFPEVQLYPERATPHRGQERPQRRRLRAYWMREGRKE